MYNLFKQRIENTQENVKISTLDNSLKYSRNVLEYSVFCICIF